MIILMILKSVRIIKIIPICNFFVWYFYLIFDIVACFTLYDLHRIFLGLLPDCHNSLMVFWPIPLDRSGVSESDLLAILLYHTFLLSLNSFIDNLVVWLGYLFFLKDLFVS